MTVTYSGEVATARIGAFSKLLLRWKGSIYKLLYKEMLCFIAVYTAISLIYRQALKGEQKRLFERIVLHCETFINLIPLSFILGFYVAIVVGRWWNQYLNIPWPDRLMMYITTILEGTDEIGRVIRRTIMRYLSLAALLVFQATSVSVKKRFPTMEHLVEAGLLTENELKTLEEVPTSHGNWWVPVLWAFNLVKHARKEGRIKDDILLKTVLDELQTYRGHLGNLYSYDWISIPLVYTQVTTLAVYSFFLGCVFGRQFLDPSQGYPGHEVDFYVPVFTLLQFFFYMGWIKVAEQMINPFGEDDDDFELNWIIDRNFQAGMLVVDELHMQYPKLEKDLYYDENPPNNLPYTKSSIGTLKKAFMGSTADLSLSGDDMKLVNPMETIVEGQCLQVPHPAQLARLESQCASPLSSPTRTRHQLRNNLISTFSKSTLDGIRVNNTDRHSVEIRPLLQTLNGSSLMNTESYVEGWLQDHKHKFEGNTIQVPSTPGTPEVPDTILSVHKDSNLTDVQNEVTSPAESALHGIKENKAFDQETVIDMDSTLAVDTQKPEMSVVITDETGTSSIEYVYEKPESHQSTVTSMTPLLKDVESDPEIGGDQVAEHVSVV